MQAEPRPSGSGGSALKLAFLGQIFVFLQSGKQGLRADAENLSRTRFVVLGMAKRQADQSSFHLVYRTADRKTDAVRTRRKSRRWRAARFPEFRRERCHANRPCPGKTHRPPNA